MVPILILAAGQSSRMRGTDKLCMPVDGVPLLRKHAIAALETSAQVIIALPDRPHPRYDLVSDLNVQRLPVPDAAQGMSVSLRAGINVLTDDAEAVLVLLPDLPELTAHDMKTVIDAYHIHPDTKIVQGTSSAGTPGHPIVFVRKLFHEFNNLTGDVGAKPIVAAHRNTRVFVSLPGDRATRDLDTPEDWADWRARTGR
jgi:molybdenum cofactor cytidylyltransferase